MSYEAISAMKSFVLIGTFLLAVTFLIPRSVKSWRFWKKTEKYVHLSNAWACAILAFFLLAANFVTFMKIVLGF